MYPCFIQHDVLEYISSASYHQRCYILCLLLFRQLRFPNPVIVSIFLEVKNPLHLNRQYCCTETKREIKLYIKCAMSCCKIQRTFHTDDETIVYQPLVAPN